MPVAEMEGVVERLTKASAEPFADEAEAEKAEGQGDLQGSERGGPGQGAISIIPATASMLFRAPISGCVCCWLPLAVGCLIALLRLLFLGLEAMNALRMRSGCTPTQPVP